MSDDFYYCDGPHEWEDLEGKAPTFCVKCDAIKGGCLGLPVTVRIQDDDLDQRIAEMYTCGNPIAYMEPER